MMKPASVAEAWMASNASTRFGLLMLYRMRTVGVRTGEELLGALDVDLGERVGAVRARPTRRSPRPATATKSCELSTSASGLIGLMSVSTISWRGIVLRNASRTFGSANGAVRTSGRGGRT